MSTALRHFARERAHAHHLALKLRAEQRGDGEAVRLARETILALDPFGEFPSQYRTVAPVDPWFDLDPEGAA